MDLLVSRRGFLGSILALSVAPAIVRAESLMPVRAPLLRVAVPYLAGYTAEVWAPDGRPTAAHYWNAMSATSQPPVYVDTVRPSFGVWNIEARSHFDLFRKIAVLRAQHRRMMESYGSVIQAAERAARTAEASLSATVKAG